MALHLSSAALALSSHARNCMAVTPPHPHLLVPALYLSPLAPMGRDGAGEASPAQGELAG